MKIILAVNGSPRKEGQTNALIDEILKQCNEYAKTLNKEGEIQTEKLQISDYTIHFCTGCDACLKKPNVCPLSEKSDDSMKQIEEKFSSASALIFGAPSYFGSMPAQLKVLIDRTRPWKMAGYKLKEKIFSAVATSGLDNGGIGTTLETLHAFATTQGMMILPAAGHPVLVPNLIGSTLQGNGLKEFKKINEISEVAATGAKALAQRIVDYLLKY
jgi:multimeric flavodoxin WrbA